MKTTLTEYKPHGIWLAIGLIALSFLVLHLFILCNFFLFDKWSEFWFFNPALAIFGSVFELIIVFYLFITVQVVVKPRLVYKCWVVCGVEFPGEEIAIWEPESISLTKHRFSRRRYSDYAPNSSSVYTEYHINAKYETKTKNIFIYKSDTDARHIAEGIANALGIPLNDYT
ncbi:hypothetical protein ACLI1A_13195 [Flavobacterium sp. RHBU_3]|uniref:hypothetical protein n=1 Tax=Flavobacterium sp. RHBU_3 TaxID=3391184 RepID=UPI003984E5D4